MLLVLSPSKTLDLDSTLPKLDVTQPQFLKDAELLVKKLRTFSPPQIEKLMEISPKLAALNHQRFRDFTTPFTVKNARPALYSFKGDVYAPLELAAYGKKEIAFAQAHVRILSGLYGLLRPLDLMQAYRLEMGRKLAMGKTKDLYAFWGSRIAQALEAELATHKQRVLINLASEEYAHAVDRKAMRSPVIDVIFKEKQKDKLKIIGLFAKQARGLMTDFIIKNQIDKPSQLKEFNWKGYDFMPKLSSESAFVFVRNNS